MTDQPEHIEGQALIYATPDGTVRVEVLYGDETMWLSLNRMAELFGTTKQRSAITCSRSMTPASLRGRQPSKEF
jgi:hypothetical protein